MTTYLCGLPTDASTRRVSYEEDPTSTLQAGGLASPIYRADGGPLAPLGADDNIVLCFPRSPRQLLSAILDKGDPSLENRVFITHGLASVGFAADAAIASQTVGDFTSLICGFETWPLRSGLLNIHDVHEVQPETAFDAITVATQVSTAGLPLDARHHVEEFNATMAVVWQRTARYAPELRVVLETLERRTGSIVERIASIAEGAVSLDAARRHHYYISALVEINAGLSMVLSQSLGRPQPKLLFSDYPVGQLSLLGIGGFMRGLWGFYSHLDHHFSEANHVNRAKQFLAGVAKFDPFLDRQTTNYLPWEDSPACLHKLATCDDHKRRIHLVHLSSRFGFHETASTLGASWQTLVFSAAQQRSLLTMTHEFLHSHVREITSAIFPGDTDYGHISDILRLEATCSSGRESLQLALVSSVLRLRAVRAGVEKLDTSNQYLGVIDGFNGRPTVDELLIILNDGLRHVQEIIVHVLDYLYCFGSDDANYLASIWRGWSTVPSVPVRLHEYVLRSMCALAALSSPEQVDPGPVFDDVTRRLAEQLQAASASSNDPILASALEYLQSNNGQARLESEFGHAYYVVRLTMAFFYDPALASALLRDPKAVVDDDDDVQTGYALNPGDYPETRVASPLHFLSLRLRAQPVEPTVKTEFESLWQVTLLAEGDREW